MTRLLPLAALAVLVLCQTAPAQPAAGKKVALVVGVNKYTKPGLTNLDYAEADATDLAATLTAAGFQVQTLTGAAVKRDAYFVALDKLLKDVGKPDTVLLAFSGHGVQLFVKDGDQQKEVPFFCPADAVPTDPSTLVSLNAVLKELGTRGGGHNLVLVDACRNVVDPTRGARGFNGRMVDNLAEGTAVFFSCSSRQRAVESAKAGGGHGVFFHFVLEGLKGAARATDEGGRVTWERLVPFVKEQVLAAGPVLLADVPAAERQVPFAIGSLGNVPPLTEPRRAAAVGAMPAGAPAGKPAAPAPPAAKPAAQPLAPAGKPADGVVTYKVTLPKGPVVRDQAKLCQVTAVAPQAGPGGRVVGYHFTLVTVDGKLQATITVPAQDITWHGSKGATGRLVPGNVKPGDELAVTYDPAAAAAAPPQLKVLRLYGKPAFTPN